MQDKLKVTVETQSRDISSQDWKEPPLSVKPHLATERLTLHCIRVSSSILGRIFVPDPGDKIRKKRKNMADGNWSGNINYGHNSVVGNSFVYRDGRRHIDSSDSSNDNSDD